MSTLFYEKHLHPFDLLFRDFFNTSAHFAPATETKAPHPLDIYEDKNGLCFEIACTGLNKDEISIDIEGDILRVSHDKNESIDKDKNYVYKGIAKRSFNLGYKVASRFDLSKSEAKMENGLLTIFIPLAETSKPKTLKIK